MPRQTTTPLPQLIYPRIIHLRRRLKDIIYKPITTTTNNNNEERDSVEISIGPTHQSFISWDVAITEEYEPINVGDKFSPASVTYGDGIKEFPWTQRWFRVDIDLDMLSLQQKEDNKEEGHKKLNDDELYLYFLANGEFTVYTSKGDVWCGIDPIHDRIPLTPLLPQQGAHDDGKTTSTIKIWLDGGQWQTGFWFGLEAPTDELGFRLLKVQLQQKNNLANEVYHDLSMLIEWIEYMYEKENIPLNTENGYYHPLTTVPPSLRRVLHLLNQVCDLYDRTKCLTSVKEEMKSIYKAITTSDAPMKICHVGHAHMDLVWLWPERVSYQKIIHTYSNVLQLMDKYPEFVFTMSQPPLYYHIKDKQPKLARRIQEKIHDGKWEFTGALEVEADTQIPVGEGLVRCILYGQERIKEITGCVSDTVWIPDVFGYSQCLPQIFALSEIPNFFTTKILWSTISKFPHNSFVWIGADGEESSVLTHLGVVGYSGKCSMKEAISASRSYQQADVHDEVLCPSGYGDGGGGPSDEQIERSLRLQRSFVGGETSSCWGTVKSFFQRLSEVQDELPLYRGELFLEYHRAVHTTQSDFKYNLRACERALQTREALRVISGNWVELDMETSWKRYLFALFHDATPGSSIHSVYQELNAELKLLAEAQCASAVEEWPCQPATAESSNTFTIINQLAWERFVVVELIGDVGDEIKSSHVDHFGGDGPSARFQVIDGKMYAMVKLKGLTATRRIPKCTTSPRNNDTNMEATPNLLSNGIIAAEFDEYGQLCSMSVRGEPLLLTTNEAASFTLHDDNPEAYDAWDMDHHIVWMKENALKEPVTLRVVACGDVVSILRSGPMPIGSNGSTMEIEYRLYAKRDSLQVSCFVNWMEKHKTLRYELPTQYRGDVARYGAPFNFVDRSQVPQTQKEEGQWEVPASRWASVLDGCGNGLSIITESKYGFRAKMGALSFTLLRSSTFPDPTADQGKHTIQFAISKHQNSFLHNTDTGDLIIPTAAKADELFTQPVVLSTHETSLLPKPFIHFISLGSVVPSWVMPSTSENHRGNSFCIRLHEVSGCNTNILFSILRLDDKMTNVETVNFNEKCLSELEATSSDDVGDQEGRLCYNLTIGAYKIVTVRISYT